MNLLRIPDSIVANEPRTEDCAPVRPFARSREKEGNPSCNRISHGFVRNRAVASLSLSELLPAFDSCACIRNLFQLQLAALRVDRLADFLPEIGIDFLLFGTSVSSGMAIRHNSKRGGSRRSLCNTLSELRCYDEK